MEKETINAIIERPGPAFVQKIGIRLIVIDDEKRYYKSVFKRHKLHYFPLQIMAGNTRPYIVMRGILFFPNYDALSAALEDLEKAILICGRNDYPEICAKIIEDLTEN